MYAYAAANICSTGMLKARTADDLKWYDLHACRMLTTTEVHGIGPGMAYARPRCSPADQVQRCTMAAFPGKPETLRLMCAWSCDLAPGLQSMLSAL